MSMGRGRLAPILLVAAIAWCEFAASARAEGPVGTDPSSNFAPGAPPPTCDTDPTGAVCEAAAVQYLDQARANLGQPPYQLPANFIGLPPEDPGPGGRPALPTPAARRATPGCWSGVAAPITPPTRTPGTRRWPPAPAARRFRRCRAAAAGPRGERSSWCTCGSAGTGSPTGSARRRGYRCSAC